MELETLSLSNGLEIELASRGGEFLGLGEVRCGGVPLRSCRRPMFVEVRSPDAVTLCGYRVARREVLPEGLLLEFSMSRTQGGPMDWMLHSVRNRLSIPDWTAPPGPAEGTSLSLEIRPANREIGGRSFRGLRYQYRYRSTSAPVYRLLDRGTWEIGGTALGNEFWMRSCFVPSVVRIDSSGQFYSSEWYLRDCHNPNIFQFLPLQTELQGFTFTASDLGVLVTWATEVAHVRSLFEKPRGQDVICHLHEHCGDLAGELVTSPIEVLWAPGALDRVGRANLYEAVKELVHSELHSQLGMRRERVAPYGLIEEWGPADITRYARLGVPKLLAAGAKTIGLANHFENNMNVWGVSNMCCTVDYKFAESVGEERIRELCDAARAGGATVEMWGNTSVSTLTLIFDKKNGDSDRIRFLPREGSIMEALSRSADPWVRNPSGAIEADHYTPVFAVMNLRDPVVRDYWLRRWREAREKTGLGGIFLDSSFNLSSDKFHFVQNAEHARGGATADQVSLLGKFRPAEEPPRAVLSQYRAHLELVVEMQRMGYRYCNEDLGVFGIHRHGPGIEARLDCLPIWTDCLATFDAPAIRRAGADPDEVFFRGLAYRMVWIVYWDAVNDRLSFRYGSERTDEEMPTAWHIACIRAFGEVEDLMREREILPGEKGVLYRSGRTLVLWAFEPLELALDGPRTVRDVLARAESKTSRLAASPRRVYVVESG